MFPCKGYVDVCPVTKEAWEARAKIANCGYENVYHCLADSEGQKWEKCVQKTLISEGNCPMFTTDGYIDWKPCNISEASCPKSPFASNEVYKYSLCFGHNAPMNQTSNVSLDHGSDGPSLALIIGIVASVVFLILATVYMAFGFRRRRKSHISRKLLIDIAATENLLQDEIGAKGGQTKVEEGVRKLTKDNKKSIVVIGCLGNLMSTNSQRILKACAAILKFDSKQYQFPNVPEASSVKDNTIMFIYGWFGLWNDDLCSVDTAKGVCKTLSEILHNKSNVKIIIGMREDLFSKYEKKLEEYYLLFENKITPDIGLLEQEYTNYLEKLKAKCRVTREGCPCKELTVNKIRSGDDKLIGMPLKVEIISKHHDIDVIESYVKHWDILRAMVDHFTALEKSNKYVYECIMYICLKGYFLRSEFDNDLVKLLKFKIQLSSFDDHYPNLSKYIRVLFPDPQNVSSHVPQCVLWHPFIYICAFHSLYENHKESVMEHCNLNAILQLVRPSSYQKSHIEVYADDSDIKTFRKRLDKLGPEEKKKYKDHPLIK